MEPPGASAPAPADWAAKTETVAVRQPTRPSGLEKHRQTGNCLPEARRAPHPPRARATLASACRPAPHFLPTSRRTSGEKAGPQVRIVAVSQDGSPGKREGHQLHGTQPNPVADRRFHGNPEAALPRRRNFIGSLKRDRPHSAELSGAPKILLRFLPPEKPYTMHSAI